MGAKFIVDRRCAVKTSLTLTGLIEAIKYKGLLRRVGELAASGTIAGGENVRLDLVLPPEVGLPGDMTVKDLQEQTALLMNHRVTCRQCPSALGGHVGGCITYVPYPISEGMEYLLWTTAVRALEGDLPDELVPAVRDLAVKAQGLKQTSFADGMRKRGDLMGPRPRVWQKGPVWSKQRLTSAQVLDAFFVNGVLTGDDLIIHIGYLQTALAVARAMAPALKDEEQRTALAEETLPYATVLELMETALEQGFGVYVWP